MATYSKEFKEKLIKLMLPPENKPVKKLVEEYHINEQTLDEESHIPKRKFSKTPA